MRKMHLIPEQPPVLSGVYYHWPMNEYSGSIANEVIVGKYMRTLNGGVDTTSAWSNNSPNSIGGSIYYNNDNYTARTGDDFAALATTDNISICAWVYLADQPYTAGNIIAQNRDGAHGENWLLKCRSDPSASYIEFRMSKHNGSTEYYYHDYDFTKSIWTHIGFTIDRSILTSNFYLDGTYVSSEVSSYGPWSTAGSEFYTGYLPAERFMTNMTDLWLAKSVLTDEEVLQIFKWRA